MIGNANCSQKHLSDLRASVVHLPNPLIPDDLPQRMGFIPGSVVAEPVPGRRRRTQPDRGQRCPRSS